LLFELRALGGELLSNALYYICDQGISLFYCLPGLIDERGLYLIPPCAKLMQFIVGK
jgi:hypothetical protein